MKALQITVVLGLLVATVVTLAQGYYVPQMFAARASRMPAGMMGKGGPGDNQFQYMNANEKDLIRIIHYLENVGRRRR